MHNTHSHDGAKAESTNSDTHLDLGAKAISISEIEIREEAVIEWFPGDWQICLTHG